MGGGFGVERRAQPGRVEELRQVLQVLRGEVRDWLNREDLRTSGTGSRILASLRRLRAADAGRVPAGAPATSRGIPPGGTDATSDCGPQRLGVAPLP